MSLVSIIVWASLWVGLSTTQADDVPAYVREGNRTEQAFRAHRDRLDQFFESLRSVVAEENPALLTELQDPPPEPVVYGYQLAPRVIDDPPAADEPVSSFSYSWPITQSYVEGEGVKLARAENQLREIASAGDEKAELLASLVREYRSLVQNQRTIDQYVEYNRFWQRSIALDKSRFDRLTALYHLMKSGSPDSAAAIAETLGKPDPPSFIRVDRREKDIILRVPVYTDIEDTAFLDKATRAIEEAWQARDGNTTYAVKIDLRRRSDLYGRDNTPRRGDHIDLSAHTARFPGNGAVWTTGAEFTHSVAGRYIAFGSGDLSARTLAHEFGHVLGFRDGYIRGYRDLGSQGFEILELTSSFDDIMSAPREGHVQPAHFKLLLDALK